MMVYLGMIMPLKFTPLEFETSEVKDFLASEPVKIYSVGV